MKLALCVGAQTPKPKWERIEGNQKPGGLKLPEFPLINPKEKVTI
jgi:hypothetical protein